MLETIQKSLDAALRAGSPKKWTLRMRFADQTFRDRTELIRLSTSNPESKNRAWKDGAVLLFCTAGYATLHYVRK